VQIDWFTFVAQIFNFTLLVFLLKRFLYRPVLGAIDRREEGIRNRLEEAIARELATQEERKALEAQQAEFKAQRPSMLREVTGEVEELRKERTRDMQAQLKRRHEEWQNSLRQQEAGFLEELSRKMARESFSIADRVLSELANSELNDRVIRSFLERLPESGEEARREFVKAVEESRGRVHVETAFPLTSDHRDALASTLEDWTGTRIEIEFREDPTLTLGIEIRAGDRKVAWSAESILDGLRAVAVAHLGTEDG
jgi:F-type H+-transporting ATPase subunit b